MRPARVLPLVLLSGCMGQAPAAPRPAAAPPAPSAPAAAFVSAAQPVMEPPPAAPGPGFGPPGARLDSMDYAVYATVLREVTDETPGLFVVMDSTRAVHLDAITETLLSEAIEELAPRGGQLVGRLAYVSEARYPIQPALPMDRGTYRLMSETEFRALFGLRPGQPFHPHPRNGWQALVARYPDADGRHEFSRVAYDYDRTMALVLYEHRCGNICSYLHYVVLRRHAGEPWKVVDSLSAYTNGDDHTYDGQDGHGMPDTVVASIPQGWPAAPDSTP